MNDRKKHTSKKTDFGAIKKLIAFAKPYSGFILLALLFSVIQIAATLLTPVVTGNTVDHIIEKGNVNFEVIGKNSIVLGGLIVVAIVFQYLSSLCINHASYKVIGDVRKRAFDKLNSVPLSYIDGHSHGDLIARVSSDIDQISDGLIQGFSQLFNGIVTIVGTLAFLLSYNWLIAVAVVFLTPVSLFVAYFIAKGCHDMFAKQAEKRGEISGLVTEMLSGQKIVKLFRYEKRAEERFGEINGELKKWGQNAAFFSALTNPCTRFINNVVYVAVCMLGAYLVISDKSVIGVGTFTVGALSCCLTYANQYTKPFNEITGVITELQTATAAAARVFELLETPDQPSDAHCPALCIKSGDVAFENVCFSYDKTSKLIENFNLSAKSGERIAIVGPTGCGKTTLINLLMRFYDVDSGKIFVDGQDSSTVTRSSLRSAYGMVLQDSWLKKGTVRENLLFGKQDATEEEMFAAANAANAHGFISRMKDGYDTVLDENGGNISVGQKQLLCIARVMLTRPPMLILDEATSSVDTRTELKIQRAFDKLMQGRTSFIVAHRLSTVKNANLILVMQSGEIIEKGTHFELIDKGGFYARLYDSQFEK